MQNLPEALEGLFHPVEHGLLARWLGTSPVECAQGIDLDAFSHVKRWYEAIAERPAVRRGYYLPSRAEDIPMP